MFTLEKELYEQIAADLIAIRERKPLLHHITNMVVMNETANATLCLGALPVMAHASEEVEEMVAFAGALILNIGTLYPKLIRSMIAAGKKANELGVPVVLDPVGVGATSLRTESARQILDEIEVSVIRGNAAEVSILGGFEGEIRGVESVGGGGDLAGVASDFARRQGGVVAITGKEDIVSDGTRTAVVANGDRMLGTVTGTGCMSTTIVGGFSAVQNDPFKAAVGALVAFGLAGEAAAKIAGDRPGSFHVSLYDSLALLSPDDIEKGARVTLS